MALVLNWIVLAKIIVGYIYRQVRVGLILLSQLLVVLFSFLFSQLQLIEFLAIYHLLLLGLVSIAPFSFLLPLSFDVLL